MNTYFENKRVALFTAETVPSFAGGGRHAFSLANYLQKIGAQSTIVCYNYNNSLEKQEVIQCVRIRRMLYVNRNVFSKAISVLNLIRHYCLESAKNDILIIYGKYLIAYPVIIGVGKLFNKKVIYRSTLYGEDDLGTLKISAGWRWPLLKSILSMVDCFWAINTKIAHGWKGVGAKDQLLEMPQCIDESVFNEKLANRNMNSVDAKQHSKLQIMSCGILIERKGYRAIFEALAKVNIDYKYTVVGQFKPEIAHRSSESERQEMVNLLKLGKDLLGDKVEFVGTTENMSERYSDTDVFLHAADIERPNVVLEAMASGVPVICREMKNANDDILQNKVICLLFKSEIELIEIINFLPYERSQLEVYSKNASQLIKERFSFEKLLFKLAECLKRERK